MNATTCKICNSNESLVLPTDEVCAFVRFLMIPNLHLTASNTVCDDCVNVIKRQTIFRYILNDIEGNLKNDDQNISIDIDKLCGITPENLNASFEKRLCRTCLNIAERYTPLVGSLQEIFSKCLDLEPQKTVNPVVCNECVVLLEEFNTLKCLVDSNNKQIQKCDEEANGKHSEAIENDMIEILDDESKFIKIDSDLGAKCMIKCKYCKEFIYEINLKTHYNTCEELPFEANDEKFRCRYCLFETQDVAQIDGHLTYCHSYTQSKIKEQSDSVTSESEYQPENSSSSSFASCLELNVKSSVEANEPEEIIDSSFWSIGETGNLSVTNNSSEVINTGMPTSNTIHDLQKDVCPFCLEDVTHFSRHLIRKHYVQEPIKKIISMPPKSVERRDAIIMLRRQGNLTLSKELNIIKPIRKPVDNNKCIDHINYSICKYCFGVVKSHYLWRHRKTCKADLEKLPKRFGHRSDAQTFLVSAGYLGNYLAQSRVSEVFKIIRADIIGLTAKSDALICLYGESLLGKHKGRQTHTVVSQKMRKMAKLLLYLRATTTLINFIDMLKPEFYNYILAAGKIIAGYDHNSLTFKSPSVALQLGTELKLMCQIGKKAVTTKNPLIGTIESLETKRKQISDLHEMIASHWCNDVGSLAHKVLNEKKFENPKLLPTAEDVSLFNKYTSSLASSAYESLKNNEHVEANYNTLVKCTLALVLLFNRKRIGEIQFLDIDSYERPPAVIDQAEMLSFLSEFEQSLCKMFKHVVVFGKGSKPVPILFSKTTQKYADLIIHMRRTINLVPKENKYLFAISGSIRWLSGYSVIQKLASECGAHRPDLLTSNRFRKQIATILQLMNFDKDEELHQVAKFMGHTEKIHMEFYRLTENTYQTAKVAKLLLLLESGKGAEFKGKSLDEVVLDDDFLTEEIDDDNQEPSTSGTQAEKLPTSDQDENVLEKIEGGTAKQNTVKDKRWKGKASINKGRVKWNPEDKEVVLNEFKRHIKDKVAPKKREILEFINKHKSFKENDWARIKTLVYNTYRVN